MTQETRAGKQLKLTRVPARSGVVFRLSGVIDETFDKRIFEGAKGVGVIDLDGVSRITSFGVREWIQALQVFSNDYLGFVNCRPALVSQFNMVANFGGKGELVTFYAPYVCPSCGKAFEVLVDLRKQHAEIASMNPPPASCPDCKTAADFDDVPDSYFSYVSSLGAPKPPPTANALIDNDPAAFGTPLRLEKEVVGDLTALWFSGTLGKAAPLRRVLDGLEGTVVMSFAEVTRVEEDGLTALATALNGLSVDLSLARVPLDLAVHPTFAALGQLVSVRVNGFCASCDGRVKVDLDHAQVQKLVAGEPAEISCATCGRPATLDGAPANFAIGLAWKAPPAAVTAYLSTHPSGPGGLAATPAPAVPKPSAPPQQDEVGAFGKYRLVKKIGAGGMAEIFLARQVGPMGFEKKVVLKRILPSLSADEEFVTMFLQEARLAARLSHPNVVQIFDLGRVGEQYFIAMEYVKGWDLSVIIRLTARTGTTMPVEVACRIAADICAGLQAAHVSTDDDGQPQPIIHRDVSPHNVLVSSEGAVKITDFGIAKVNGGVSQTRPGHVKGKLSYMAPELVAQTHGVDARSDIFAAGVTLYQMLSGQNPFARDNEAATLHALVTTSAPPLSLHREDVPTSLDAILARAMARDRDVRYASAREFQDDLEAFLRTRLDPSSTNAVSRWLGELMALASAMAAPHGESAGTTPVAFPTPSDASPLITVTGVVEVKSEEPTRPVRKQKDG